MNKNLLVLCTLLFSGCASMPASTPLIKNVSELPSIQIVNAKRLAKLQTGMTFADFHKIFPDAYRLYAEDGRRLPVYEIVSMNYYVTRTDRVEDTLSISHVAMKQAYFQALWFYFRDERLTHWEQPKKWPSKPDQ